VARENARLCGLGNVRFLVAECERLPYADASFDLVLSNGVFNLVLDKPRALAETFRVLKPGGRLCLADQLRTAPEPDSCPIGGAESWVC
jgi:arsenite methyltransferase